MLATATRIGKKVTLRGVFFNTGNIGSSTKFGSIPVFCRPNSTISDRCYVGYSGSSPVTFHVYSDGTMDYVSGATRSDFQFCVSYDV